MTYTAVQYTVSGTHGAIATIALNRPEARNGYTLEMSDELHDAFNRADDDSDVRVVILTGNGSDFTVGADLAAGALAGDAAQDWGSGPNWDEPAGRCALRIFAMDKPVIAAVHGAAVGAGSTIILPADFRLAAKGSRFGFVFSRRGIYPEGASVWFLPRLVGMGAAMDWMVSGRVFDAEEALTKGMITSLHEPDELLAAAHELAGELIAKTAPVSVAVIRQMLYRLSALDSPLAVQRIDSRLIGGMLESPDAIEGITSFLQRRDPQFPGRVPEDIPAWLPWRSAD